MNWRLGPFTIRSTSPPEADASADVAGTDTARAIRRVRRGRRNLAAFDHLPVTRIVHDLGKGEKDLPLLWKTL